MAASASRLLTMLPSTPQVQSVYLDPTTGILPGLLSLPSNTPLLPRVPSSSVPDQTDTAAPSAQPNTLLVDGTTLDPTVAMEVAKRIHEETGGKALMIDAPVSGGESGRGL
jgi:3-hydroxyisobutyrate dehydrogenase